MEGEQPHNPDATAAGGPGWGIREPRQRAPERIPEMEAAPPPPPPPPPADAPVPQAPWERPAQRSNAGRSAAIAGIACTIAGIVFMSLFVVGHQTPSAQSGNPLFAAGAPTLGPSDTSTPAGTGGPSASPAAPGVNETDVQRAAQEYLVAVAPVNAGFDRFGAALEAPAHCTCPTGEVNISSALTQIPSMQSAMSSLQTVLRQIETQLPSFSVDINAALADNQTEYMDLAHCIDANNARDANALTQAVLQFADDQTASEHDFMRLRTDLQLPPPPGATAQSVTASAHIVS